MWIAATSAQVLWHDLTWRKQVLDFLSHLAFSQTKRSRFRKVFVAWHAFLAFCVTWFPALLNVMLSATSPEKLANLKPHMQPRIALRELKLYQVFECKVCAERARFVLNCSKEVCVPYPRGLGAGRKGIFLSRIATFLLLVVSQKDPLIFRYPRAVWTFQTTTKMASSDIRGIL